MNAGAPRPEHRNAMRAIRWGAFALVFSAALMALKFGAFLVTDSAAVLSDALESTVNIVTSGFALFAVWLSAQPGDSDHPYGHGRIEYIAQALESVALIVAGVSIAIVTATRFAQGAPPQSLDLGLVCVSFIGVLALVGGTMLIQAGKRLDSPTLRADGAHIRADAVTTFGTLIGLGLVRLTGAMVWDYVASWVIALWLLVHGLQLLRLSVNNLMDQADPRLLHEIADMLEEIREPGWTSPHRTKVHRLGREIHVDMHIVMPRFWELDRAHAAASRMEQEMSRRYGTNAEMMVHMEPCEELACVRCTLEDCPIRASALEERRSWTGEAIADTRRYPELPHGHGLE